MHSRTNETPTRGARRPIDVSGKDDVFANSTLCGWDTIVFTNAGRIEPQTDGMVLVLNGRRGRFFRTASGALEVLRRASR